MKQGFNSLVASLVYACALAISAPALATDSVFTAIPPCRIVDTRLPGAGGPLSAGETRSFNVVGNTLNSPNFQGAEGSDCGIPGFSSGPQVQAVVFNFVAVGASGPGDLVAWPTDQAQPLASIINFASQAKLAGLNIANGLVVAVRQDQQGDDLSVIAFGGVSVEVYGLGYLVPSADAPHLTPAVPHLAGSKVGHAPHQG